MTQTNNETGEVFNSRLALDWLQWTVPHTLKPSEVLPDHPAFDVIENCSPLKNYEIGFRLACGARISVSTKRPEHMGVNILMTGDDLEACRKYFSDDDILGWAQSNARKFSRVDVALDVEHKVDYSLIPEHYHKGKIETRMNYHSKYFHAASGGHSVYFGSPKSDRRVVVYDKSAEMGLLGVALARVEMRTKNRLASQMVAQMKQDGVPKGGRIQIMYNFNYDAPWFQQAVGHYEQSDIVKPEPKPDRWEQWLFDVVLRSIEKSKELPERKLAIQKFKEEIKDV